MEHIVELVKGRNILCKRLTELVLNSNNNDQNGHLSMWTKITEEITKTDELILKLSKNN